MPNDSDKDSSQVQVPNYLAMMNYHLLNNAADLLNFAVQYSGPTNDSSNHVVSWVFSRFSLPNHTQVSSLGRYLVLAQIPGEILKPQRSPLPHEVAGMAWDSADARVWHDVTSNTWYQHMEAWIRLTEGYKTH